MGWNTYARSKMPLKLVLILMVAFAVNFGIVLGFQALVTYRYADPIDSEALTRFDSKYQDATIVDMTWNSVDPDSNVTVYLVEMADEQYEFVTVQKHYMLQRYRFVKSGCIALEPDTTSVDLRAGSQFFNIELRYKEDAAQPDIIWAGMFGSGGRNAFSSSMFLSVVLLCFVELAAYCLLFKRHEIQ